ncbi:MAG TPA: ParB/RepB/Spo0J family partition protein, partial [Candidatus Saccharimonadales bacterium]|nr:ParB/RepB/Spo0J family partition protein [Candidatus Saccharimonadales bacterium]
MSAQKPTLGRGLGALISDDLDRSLLQEDNERVQKILISDIVPNPDQPRRQFDQTALAEMAESIRRHGVLQPVIVTRISGQNSYRIIAGERRWRAAQLAKLSHLPAIVRSMQELEAIELSLIENIQRVDLSPLEQAMSVYKLQQQFNLGLEEIAQKLGKATSTISNLTRLLQLPTDAMEALRQAKISEGHARAILSLKGMADKQTELLRSIQNNSWTVRQAEQFATAAKKGADAKGAKQRTASETQLTKQIGATLSAKVQIKHTAKGGQLIIRFDSDEHL